MPKDTFIIRTEWADSIFELQPEEQAIILQNMFHYHMGNENLINLNNLSVRLVWKFLEPAMKRNIDGYDRRKETSRLNGALGGRPPKVQEVTEDTEPNENLKKPNEPNGTLPVPVPVPVPVPDNSNTDLVPEKPKPAPETVEQRKQKFAQKLEPWKETYTREMLNDFYLYWTEKGEQDRKMRFEKEKVFEVERRLQYWKKIQDQKQNRFQQVQTPPKIRIVDGKFK